MNKEVLSKLYFSRPVFFQKGHSFDQLFPHKKIRYGQFARNSLVDGLLVLGVQPNSRILLPSFICRDLLSVVHHMKCIPVFYDVNKDLTPKESPENWPKAEVVLAINFFGFAQQLKPFFLYKKLNGAILVEDNAHGFLSKDSCGHWLGTRTELGIFSFRKALPIGVGAGYFLKDEAIEMAIEHPVEPNLMLGIKFHLKNFIAFLAAKIRFIAFLISYLLSKKSGGINRAWLTLGTAPEKNLPTNESAISMKSIQYIESIDIAVEIERRRNLYIGVHLLIKDHPRLQPVFCELDSNTAPYMFPFFAEDENSLYAFANMLQSKGLRLIRWPDLPLELRDHCPDFYKQVWAVPFIW